MIDHERFQLAVLETAMRVLTVKAGGEIIVSKADYLNYVKDDLHFHYEKDGDEIKFMTFNEGDCPYDAQAEPRTSVPIFGPTGFRIK